MKNFKRNIIIIIIFLLNVIAIVTVSFSIIKATTRIVNNEVIVKEEIVEDVNETINYME